MASGRVSRLTPEQIKDIRSSTEPRKVIARKYNIHISYICHLRKDLARGKSLTK